jgi:uncharacterized protein
MIRVTIQRNSDGRILSAEMKGHAGYADEGFDIVCAAVSILVQNAVNSVEALCHVELDTTSRGGYLSFRSESYVHDHNVQLLLESMVLGLRGIAQEYDRYVEVRENTI